MSFDLTKLEGFNFNGLEVDEVVIDSVLSDPGSPTDYVPGSTTYNVLGTSAGSNSGFESNDSDQNPSGMGVVSDMETVANTAINPATGNPYPAASNGTTLTGGSLANPLALGQIAIMETINGTPNNSVTYDVLGYSNDGSTILLGLSDDYDPGDAQDPYDGNYVIISDANIDGNNQPTSNFPSAKQTFTTTHTYTGGPSSTGGVAADLVTLTNMLGGISIPANTLTQVSPGGSGITLNANGSYTVVSTSNTLSYGAGTLTKVTSGASVGTGAEGQGVLLFNNSLSPIYFQVVGWNATQILLEVVKSNGQPLASPQYDILSITSSPPANSSPNITFSNFGVAPIAGVAYCFLGGTRIATPEGERNVEDLRIGDLVLTLGGPARPVRWLGRSTVATRFADPQRCLPVRIRAGALGDATPVRDLLVSPDHAMFLDGYLVHAGALVNGTSIIRETNVPASFIYYHLELDEHALVLAEGAVAETFVDNVDRMAFDNWNEHPVLTGEEMIELPYPRAKSARQVPLTVRKLIAKRAMALFVRLSQAA